MIRSTHQLGSRWTFFSVALEQRLHVTLLNRTTRRQSLTEVGRRYYERCLLVLREAAAADALASETLSAPLGQLRVSAPYQFGSQSLIDFAAEFMTRYPLVQIDLRLSDKLVNLVEEGIEVAFRIGDLHIGESSSLIVRPLRPYTMIACASPAYLRRAGTPQHPQELSEHECLGFVFSNQKVFNEWVFFRDGETIPVHVNCRFQVNGGHAQLRAALAGAGILLAADDLVQGDLACGKLVRVLEGFQAPSRPMHVIYTSDRQRSAKVQRFVEEALGAFSVQASREPDVIR